MLRSASRGLRRAGAVVPLVLSLSGLAAAQEDQRGDAAQSFDEGVRAYERAAYEQAARAFMRADELAPADVALGNALQAGRRAGSWLLVVEAAERAISREATSPDLATKGRRALAEASAHLAKLELDCEPAPCSLRMDAAPAKRDALFVLPGTHVLEASGAGSAASEQRVSFAAGAAYRVLLHLTRPGDAPKQSSVTSEKTRAAPGEGNGKPDVRRDARPLHPAFFYAAAGVTVALVGVTTWSGLDALSAKNDLPDRPTKAEVASVQSKVRRTDFLVAGSALAAAATAYIGIALVDFSGGRAQATLSPLERSVALRGWF